MGKTYEETFHQGEYTNINKHMKKFSTSLVIRKMKIITVMRYFYSPMRMAKIKNSDNTK